MTKPSPLYALIETKLDGTLAEFVAGFVREQGMGFSWSALAAELAQRTGHPVSDETLRRWFADRIRIEVVVEANGVPPDTPRPSTPPTTPRPPSSPSQPSQPARQAAHAT